MPTTECMVIAGMFAILLRDVFLEHGVASKTLFNCGQHFSQIGVVQTDTFRKLLNTPAKETMHKLLVEYLGPVLPDLLFQLFEFPQDEQPNSPRRTPPRNRRNTYSLQPAWTPTAPPLESKSPHASTRNQNRSASGNSSSICSPRPTRTYTSSLSSHSGGIRPNNRTNNRRKITPSSVHQRKLPTSTPVPISSPVKHTIDTSMFLSDEVLTQGVDICFDVLR